MKIKFRQILSFVLVFAMVLGTFASHSITVNAASTATVTLSGMGSHGSLTIGSKTKTGTWWKMHVGSREAFCITLGATCHSGNTYEVAENCTWTQDTGGEKRGYYAKIFKWYVINCKRSKKSYIMSQALLWSVAEGRNSKSQLKDIIKDVKKNTGYYSSKTADELYTSIFENTGNFEVKATYWKKSGGTKGYQTLLTVDADIPEDFRPKHLSKSKYYRQRVTVQKNDDLGNPLDGIQFQLDAHNIDELYSFSVGDANGTESSNVDAYNDTEFSMIGVTRDNGTIAYRMTYYLQSYNEVYYYTDSELANMTDEEKKAAKKVLTDELELDQGIDFGKNMTKAEAEVLAQKQIDEQIKSINNGYTLTEIDTSAHPEVIKDPNYANGFNFKLGRNNSWTKDSNGNWPDTLIDTPRTYALAYQVGVKNKVKKASVKVVKHDPNSIDGEAHGDATLDGAVYKLYSDEACTSEAQVYTADGEPKSPEDYVTENGGFETDFLLTGKYYYLKEIKAPKGYLLNGEVTPIYIDPNIASKEITINAIAKDVIENPVLGKVEIQKYFNEDDPGFLNPEPGAVFQVYLKSAGSYEKADPKYERDEIVTDDKGYAITKDLYYGKYVVHQVSSGPVDTINVADFEVDIKENGKVYTYQLRNPYFKAFLKVLKKDKNTEKQVLKEGTAYQIYKVLDDGTEEKVVQTYSNGNQKVSVDTFTTDASGEIMTVKELKSATYRIYEVESASGLHITDKYIEVTINSKLDNYTEEVDEEGYKHVTVTVTYTNEETSGRFFLKKTGEQLTSWDAEKKEFVFEEANLEGVEFEIYADGDIVTQDNQGTKWFDDGELVATITTGKDVKFTRDINNLTGYELAKDGTLTVNLPLGKYTVKEKKTLYGYVFPKDTKWNLEFTWENSQEPFVLNTTDATDKKGVLAVKNSLADTKLKLVKIDDISTKGIEGAVFGFYTKNDIYNAKGEKIVDANTLLRELTTDASGNAECDLKVPLMDENYETPSVETSDATETDASANASGSAVMNLNSGDYYLKELSISDSYYLDDSEIPVHFEYADPKTKTIEREVRKTNTQTFTEIDKLSLTDSKEVAGCKLQISDVEGNVLVSWISGDKDSVEVNDKLKELGYENVSVSLMDNGNLIVQGLLHDKEYVLKETRPADGYVTADDIHFMVKKNPNETIGKPVFIPALPVSGDAISADASANASGSAISSKTFGDDSVVAIKNAEGIFENKTDAKVIMYDDTTKISVSKTDITGEKEIPGCELSVVASGGAVIDEWTSTNEEHLIENKLIVGETYTLTEKRPADGYVTADSVEFTVEDNGEIQKVEMHDEETDIKLIKVDAKTGQGLAGAKFVVLDKDGNEVMKFTSKEDGVSIKGKLAVGQTYTFHEVSAPNGYKTAKDVKYTVEDTSKVQKVTIKDEKIPSTPPHVPQTGFTSFAMLIMLLGLAASIIGVIGFRKKLFVRKSNK